MCTSFQNRFLRGDFLLEEGDCDARMSLPAWRSAALRRRSVTLSECGPEVGVGGSGGGPVAVMGRAFAN